MSIQSNIEKRAAIIECFHNALYGVPDEEKIFTKADYDLFHQKFELACVFAIETKDNNLAFQLVNYENEFIERDTWYISQVDPIIMAWLKKMAENYYKFVISKID